MGAVHVPGELVEDILSRVAVKSLLRLKTCSKKWYSLLSQNHQFANYHLKINHSNSTTVIFQDSSSEPIFESLNIDTNTSRIFNFPVQIEMNMCLDIGSANGLVCLAPFNKGGCFIWNPCTGEYKRISVPVRHAHTKLSGFGYDSYSDDYKIVGHWGNNVRVFSLKANSWKTLECCFCMMRHKGFQFNGALYWCFYGKVVSFDLAKELFSDIQLPDYFSSILTTPFWEYQGLLYLSVGKSIWILTKEFNNNYGKHNWVELDRFLPKEYYAPLGISSLGEFVYRTKVGSGFVKSDLQGNLSDDDTSQIVCPHAFVYTESLISPKCFDAPKNMMIKRPRKQRKTCAT